MAGWVGGCFWWRGNGGCSASALADSADLPPTSHIQWCHCCCCMALNVTPAPPQKKENRTLDKNIDQLSRHGSFHACQIRSWNAKPRQENWSVNAKGDNHLITKAPSYDMWYIDFFFPSTYLYTCFWSKTIDQKKSTANKKWWLHSHWIISVNTDTLSLMHVPVAVVCQSLHTNSQDARHSAADEQLKNIAYISMLGSQGHEYDQKAIPLCQYVREPLGCPAYCVV